MRNAFLTTTLIVLTAIFSSAGTANDDKANSAVGLSAGWVVANGVIYRHYLENGFLQGTFAVYADKGEKSNENPDPGDYYGDGSISFGHYLNKIELKQVATPIGLKWISGLEGEFSKSPNNPKEEWIHVGSGLGLDIGNIGKPGFLISWDVIFTLSFSGFSNPSWVSFKPTASLGVLYNF